MIKDSVFENINFDNKHYFIGVSLGSCSTNETGVAIIDKGLNIITLDKLFSMEDVRFFFKRVVGKQNVLINVALTENPQMLNAKWKLLAREYQLVQSCELLSNNLDWIERYSHRGCDFFSELKAQGFDIFRYDIRELKSSLGLSGVYKDRTPVDCKALQSALRHKFGFDSLPSNMLPVSQLEALLGSYLGLIMAGVVSDYNCKSKAMFNEIDVIGICR